MLLLLLESTMNGMGQSRVARTVLMGTMTTTDGENLHSQREIEREATEHDDDEHVRET